MTWFKITFVLAVFAGLTAHADGPLPQLSDPVVIPAPIVIQNGPLVAPGLAPPVIAAGGQGSLLGYPVNIAWDHVAVGAAILGVMYALGADAPAAGTF
ncbi:hypothetical protein [Yoonia sp. 208BN28-4]|uniref:hypothetical protein n=1 Tax=Yoonia sp. 208BN28-4 TaxID=3126505 RepID=UPI00309C6C05